MSDICANDSEGVQRCLEEGVEYSLLRSWADRSGRGYDSNVSCGGVGAKKWVLELVKRDKLDALETWNTGSEE